MLANLRKLLEINHDITRHFDLDYIVLDAVFLVIYTALLIRAKRWAALRVGGICAVLMYLIDGVAWYATGVREYVLPARWLKHPVDFMMDFSYGLAAFSWVWIAFERRSAQDVLAWTAALFGGWLAVAVLSQWLPLLLQVPITTVRHMSGQVPVQIGVVVGGYLLLAVLRYDVGTLLYVFWVGCMLAFMMEFSLFVAGIRPTDVKVLIYETLILTNQGIPYLFVIRDKVAPALARQLELARTRA